jgi:galactose-1-phosphate uridylyltransferase family 2
VIEKNINKLVAYGIQRGLITPQDRTYVINRILEVLCLDGFRESPAGSSVRSADCESAGSFFRPEYRADEKRSSALSGADCAASLPDVLSELTDFAYDKGLIPENTVTYRDLFDTKLMGCLTPRPSEVIRQFESLYAQSPRAATDWFYGFCCDTNYIRIDRIAKDVRWKTPTQFGEMDITINLSKPEKDPAAIAAAHRLPSSSYPQCQLCKENEGYAGRVNHPARQNLRIIPITLNGEPWYFQYSPYVYYNEHCIVLSSEHTPMRIDRSCFYDLLDFVRQFPHYFIGSNAGLPIVGGSILSHEHFQGGRYTFPIEFAPLERKFAFDGHEDVEAGIVKWPLSTIRLVSADIERLVDLADRILTAWHGYSDESVYIFAVTNGEPHNTVTPIARMRSGKYELDIILRNNITSDEHPLGVFHPHSEIHHIKKENIGLIEAMGLAVLPPRLKEELSVLARMLVSGGDPRSDERTVHHAEWAEKIAAKYSITDENVEQIIKDEVGRVFVEGLEHCGVFKRTSEGAEAFNRFINYINSL